MKAFSPRKIAERSGKSPRPRRREETEMCESAQRKRIVAQSRCAQGFRGSAGDGAANAWRRRVSSCSKRHRARAMAGPRSDMTSPEDSGLVRIPAPKRVGRSDADTVRKQSAIVRTRIPVLTSWSSVEGVCHSKRIIGPTFPRSGVRARLLGTSIATHEGVNALPLATSDEPREGVWNGRPRRAPSRPLLSPGGNGRVIWEIEQ